MATYFRNVEDNGIWEKPTGDTVYNYYTYEFYAKHEVTPVYETTPPYGTFIRTYTRTHLTFPMISVLPPGSRAFAFKEFATAQAFDATPYLYALPNYTNVIYVSPDSDDLEGTVGKYADTTVTSSDVGDNPSWTWRKRKIRIAQATPAGTYYFLTVVYTYAISQDDPPGVPYNWTFTTGPTEIYREILTVYVVDADSAPIDLTEANGRYLITHKSENGAADLASLSVDDSLVGWNISEANIAPKLNTTYSYQWNDEDEREIRIIGGVADRPMKHQISGKQRAGDTIWHP